MIYMKAGGQAIVILEPSNIQRLQDGKPVHTPDEAVLIAYCPDIDWLASELMNMLEGRSLDLEKFDALLREGLKREPVYKDDSKMRAMIPPKKSDVQ